MSIKNIALVGGSGSIGSEIVKFYKPKIKVSSSKKKKKITFI